MKGILNDIGSQRVQSFQDLSAALQDRVRREIYEK